MQQRIVIVGAGGYSGAELVSILLGHPSARVVGVFGSGKEEGSRSLADAFPRFRGRLELPLRAADVSEIASCNPDAVFLATPHEASVSLAAALIDRGVRVLDLSAAFRFRDPAIYPSHYGFAHEHPNLLQTAVYGLPELHRDQIRTARLVAVPGCYPTSAILPLAPLVRAGAVTGRPIIDSTSGVSGAGRAAKLNSLFCEVSLQPYNVFKHRHNPEIDTYAGVSTVFTPHLGAFDRGILSTIHVELAAGWDLARVSRTLTDAYGRERFVRLFGAGVWPAVADVRNTNFCDIGWAVDEKHHHLIIASVIDNLVKGAAGQAVQCMNLCLGLDESLGLPARSEAHS